MTTRSFSSSATAPSCTVRFSQLDVFTDQPMLGNPLAVVHDATELEQASMQRFAAWTHLSETTFLLPPTLDGADYQVRIFTPGGELPFAGHPTLGSCHAWLLAGGRPRNPELIVQQCGIGLVRVRLQDHRLAFAAPPLLRDGPLDNSLLERIARALGLDRRTIRAHQWVDNGPGWCAVMLDSAQRVRSVRPDFSMIHDLKLGLIGPQSQGSDTAFEVRAFVPALGVPEDPVTGSLNAGLALWLMRVGLAPNRYVAAQGSALGRSGRIHVERLGEDVWVGGDVTNVIQGTVQLPLK